MTIVAFLVFHFLLACVWRQWKQKTCGLSRIRHLISLFLCFIIEGPGAACWLLKSVTAPSGWRVKLTGVLGSVCDKPPGSMY